jgi:regulator of nonsense transcripts 2
VCFIDKDEKVQEDGFEESDGSDTSSDEENEDDRLGDLDKEDEEIDSADEVDLDLHKHPFVPLTFFLSL